MPTFGERLKALRLKNDLAQKEIGAWINVSDSSIRKYESGDRTPSPEVIRLLATRFGVTTDYLLGHDAPNPVSTAEAKDLIAFLYKDEPEKLKLFRDISASGTLKDGRQLTDIDLRYIKEDIDRALERAEKNGQPIPNIKFIKR